MTEQAPSVEQIAAILRRRRRIILVFIVCTLGVTIAGVAVWPDTYEVSASLLVKIGREISPPTTLPGSQSMAFLGKRPEDIASEIEIMRSPYLLQKVVDRLGVEFFLQQPSPPTSLLGQTRTGLARGARQVLGWGREFLSLLGLEKRLSPRDRIVLGLQKGLSIEPVRRTDVIEIRLRTGDPNLGAEVTNTLIALYLDHHIAVYTTPKVREFFEKQMEILEAKLKAAEEAKRRFKERHGIVALEEQRNLLLRQVRELQGRSQGAEAKALESQLRELRVLDGLEMDLKRLDRTLGILEQDYALYARRREEARISEAMDREKIANISVIAPALPPPRPVAPKRLLLLLVALVLGPTGGVILAFVAEYLDPPAAVL